MNDWDDHWDKKDHTPMSTQEQIITVIVVFSLIMTAVFWLTRGWGW